MRFPIGTVLGMSEPTGITFNSLYEIREVKKVIKGYFQGTFNSLYEILAPPERGHEKEEPTFNSLYEIRVCLQ